MQKQVLIFLLIFGIAFGTDAQFNVEALTIEDGLSQGMIFDILKDKDGFLWFGTKNGLNRYDGYNFKVYTKNPFDSTSISGDEVWSIFEDKKGGMWFGTNANGLNYFDKKTEKFHRIEFYGDKSRKLSKFEVVDIIEDEKGQIWCANEHGLYCIRTQIIGQEKSFKVDIKFYSDKYFITDLYFDSQKRILLGTKHNGCFYWNTENDSLERFLPDFASKIHAAHSIVEYPKNTYWFGDAAVIYHYQNEKVSEIPLPFSTINPYAISKLIVHPNKEQIYVSAWFQNEIFSIDISSYKVEQQLKNITQSIVGENQRLYFPKLYFEDNRMLWFGTNGYGIRKLNLQTYPFKHIAQGKSIFFIYQDQQNHIFTRINRAVEIAKDINTPFEPLTNRDIWGVLETNNKEIWGLTQSFSDANQPSELIRFDAKLNPVEIVSQGGIDARYGKIIESKNGDFWFPSAIYDFVKYNKKEGNFENITCLSNSEITGERYFDIYQDGQGVIWKCTNKGLIKFNPITKQCQLYQNNPNNIKSLRNNSIAACVDDVEKPETYLWVATKGGGLNLLHKKTGECQHFTTKDGLPNNVVYAVLPDDSGNLWLSTNRGLSKFTPKTRQFTNFTVTDGLQDNEFNTGAFFKNKQTGRMFFGGINGITTFFPNEIKLSDYEPSVWITDFKIHNKSIQIESNSKEEVGILSQPIEYVKKINLAWYQNQISLEFAALDFTTPSQNIYEYKLSSVNEDWVRANKSRTANYDNLAPGKYTFEVRATNSSGIWSDKVAMLEIIIHPPWWRTTFAYFIYVALIVSSIFLLYRFQINRIILQNELVYQEKESKRLEELDSMKSDFFSNITHEFRTPLTLIIEPLRQFLEKSPKSVWTNQIILAKNNSERLLQLINQLLDLSKLEHQKMTLELSKGDVLQVIEPIVQSFQSLAEQKSIDLKYNSSHQEIIVDFDRDKIEKVIFNLLSNAIKFTNKQGKITIDINKEVNNLLIVVKDTGIGIAENQQQHIFDRFYQSKNIETKQTQGTGIGLALTNELVTLMNGTITLESIVGQGSTFSISLPLVEATTRTVAQKPIQQVDFIPHTLSTEPILLPTSVSIDATDVVLLIEDNQELRTFIKSLITPHYQVLEADNGQKGVEIAKKYLPNIVISDIMMPVMDGYEVCEILKSTTETAHIPVVLLTAKTALDSKLTGLKMGADAYLSKPFNATELLLRIKNLIDIRQQLQHQNQQQFESIKEQKQPTNPSNNLSIYDQDFLKNAYNIVEQQLENETFTVEAFANQAAMSRTQLHRKLKALLNQSASEFIRNIRLNKAKQLLENKEGNVTEVAFMVGFSSSKYFSTKFKEKFGISPSEV